ncbi:MAG: hypothetical protein U9O89_07730 [Thermoproteota archaeon]|nr:hypothetical protein [Thermoproteota archaeon]
MPKKRKRKEIVVTAPTFRREEELLRDTSGAEAFDVFKASGKIGRHLSVLMIIVGVLLSIFSAYSIITSTPFLFSNPFFIGTLGFLGAINVFCGLILLAKE